MGSNHDYQRSMTDDVASVDTAGEMAADQTTVENYAVHEEEVTEQTPSGQHITRPVGVFGMLPSQSIPVDYASQRSDYFRKLAEETGTHSNPLTGWGSARDTAAYRSQKHMMEDYSTDAMRLPDAQRDYALLVPLANMAAKSYQKANEVGAWTGLDDLHGPSLSAKEQAALGKSGQGQDGPMLEEQASLQLAVQEMMIARRGVVEASQAAAIVIDNQALGALREELAKAKDGKEAIEQKIEKVAHIVGYVETAGSLIAGGAGFVNAHIPGAPAPEEAHPDLRDASVETVQKAGEMGEKGGGAAGEIVAFGMRLFYQHQLDTLDAQIDVVTGELDGGTHEVERQAVIHAKTKVDKAAHDYQHAVATYEAKINDRRAKMAEIGTKADKAAAPGGGSSDVADAMLWTTTIMETQSFLDTALDAGAAAKQSVDEVDRVVTAHRTEGWGTLSDAFTADNLPRTEGLNGPDIIVLRQMADFVRWWMEGATSLKSTIDEVAQSQGEPLLATAGYTAAY